MQVASSVAAATQLELTKLNLGLELSIAEHVESLVPGATHVFGVAMEQTSVPVQPMSPTHATNVPLVVVFTPLLQTLLLVQPSVVPTLLSELPHLHSVVATTV